MTEIDLTDGQWLHPTGEPIEFAVEPGTRVHLPAVPGEWERLPDEDETERILADFAAEEGMSSADIAEAAAAAWLGEPAPQGRAAKYDHGGRE